jgi:membrane protease YdiL (CAAX protease family)
MSAHAPSTIAASGARARRPIARWGSRFAIAAVLGALVVGQLVALGLTLAAGGEDPPLWTIGAGFLVADGITLAVVVLAARRGTERLGAATLGLRRTAFWPGLGWAATAYAGFVAISGLWLTVVGAPADEGGSGPVLADDPLGAQLLLFLVLAVTTPIVEEIVFRGYLFGALTRWRGPGLAAVLCGVLFGAAHLAVYPLELIPPLMVMGAALCLVFWFTGSLLPCIGVHAFNNALVTGVEAEWGAAVLLGIAGAVVLSIALVVPLTRERAPETA